MIDARTRAVGVLRLRSAGLVILWLAAAALERLVQLPAGFRFPGLLLLAVIATAWTRGRLAAAVGIGCAAAFTWASMGASGARAGDAGTLALFVAMAAIAATLASTLRDVRDERDALRSALARGRVDGAAAQRAVGAMQDRLDAQADWHALLLGNVAEGVVTTDAQGRVRSINATAAALTGWRADEAIGLPVAQVFGVDDREALAVLSTHETPSPPVPIRREGRLASRDGRERVVRYACSGVVPGDGTTRIGVLSFHDVTEQRRALREQERLVDAARAAEHAAQTARHELAVAHERFAAFMDAFPYPAYIQDTRGDFVFVNEAGRATRRWLEATPARGSAETLERVPGGRHYFSIRFPLVVGGHAWLGGIAIDVSERVRTQRALSERTAEFETLFRHVPAPLWIARDAQARAIEGNDAANALLGLGTGDAWRDGDGAPAFFVDGHRLAPDAWPMRVCVRERRAVPATDIEVVRADGTRRHLRVTSAPLLDAAGQPRGAVAAGLDITQLKDYEAELERAVRRRDEFLAVLAHELRNPLTPVQHSVQILHRAPEDVARVRRATATIDRQVALMDRLIADLLDVARISQGFVELDPEPRALEALVDGALDVVRPVAERTGHRFEVRHDAPSACALVDAFRAEQVLVNLLSNAVKYSPRGSVVRVATRVAGPMCVIEVADEGQGILPEHQREIFAMFARPGVGARPRTAGMGVGLALARQLAEQQGGSIEVRSAGRGLGATFTVRFPVVGGGADDAAVQP